MFTMPKAIQSTWLSNKEIRLTVNKRQMVKYLEILEAMWINLNKMKKIKKYLGKDIKMNFKSRNHIKDANI